MMVSDVPTVDIGEEGGRLTLMSFIVRAVATESEGGENKVFNRTIKQPAKVLSKVLLQRIVFACKFPSCLESLL